MFRAILIALVLALGLAFHSRNHEVVVLDFYSYRFEMPLSWAMVSALIIGATLGMLALLPDVIRIRRALRRERKRAAILTSSGAGTNGQ